MAQSHLGSTDSTSALSGLILAQEHNLYDYYTGRPYQPDGPETGDSGQTVASGSTSVEHNGQSFQLTYEKSWQSSMDPGRWTESTQPGLVRELSVDSDMSVTVVVRVPSDYDGVLLGINVTDSADPSRGFKADWDLTIDAPAHYRFIHLSDIEASIES